MNIDRFEWTPALGGRCCLSAPKLADYYALPYVCCMAVTLGCVMLRVKDASKGTFLYTAVSSPLNYSKHKDMLSHAVINV